VIGPGEAIDTSNDSTGSTDYEGELAVVIGRTGKRVAAADAWDHVFGYTVVNDVTARGLQRRHVQWLIGKGADTFCPMGPCLVTADEIPDIQAVRVKTTVNGEPRQRGQVADLIFDIPTLISTLTTSMTLEPGDVIATGTPSGVGAGFDPPRFLQAGDVVEVTVDGIGTLSNPVI
jgi:2-keto-4-pentenoate hydratase/2-oxohepta-3-ene-1,7-dioic acid hydratase in catechol pathway